MAPTMYRRKKSFLVATIVSGYLVAISSALAADHGDGPLASVKRSGDLGDIYFFLDPNDNSRAVIGITTQGFIVPGEAVNFSVFDPDLVFRIDIDTDGDAAAERHLEVVFGPKTAPTAPQTATIRLPSGRVFTAPTTTSNLTSTSPTPVITTDSESGVRFFAGEVDDPFFFDIPGFNRFVASVLAGAADATLLERGRDTFAGYNTLAIVFSFPVSGLRGEAGGATTVGLSASSRRSPAPSSASSIGSGRLPLLRTGATTQIDREGNPAVNVALVPFARKDEYNRATPLDDANLRFADSIIATLMALGTSPANIDILAGVAVLDGDYLRLSTAIGNTGPGGGTNAGAGFPNGRRPADDVIDVLMGIITNGAITMGDHVFANDKTFRDEFPFFAPTHQPFAPGTLDDLTRN